MKEILEFRINSDFAHLLFNAGEGRDLGGVRVVQLSKEDPRYNQIPIIEEELRKKHGRGFFFSWNIKRKYSKMELSTASLLHIKIKSYFGPAGEECGTMYNEAVACEICGANRKQVGPLILKRASIPNKDVAATFILSEIVVSEKFANAVMRRNLKGVVLSPVNFRKGSGYYQLASDTEVELSRHTVACVDPFDFSEGSDLEGEYTIEGVPGHIFKYEKEVYKCPKGHTLGLNLLSEPYVLDNEAIKRCDFFVSRQKLGVKRGMLVPTPIYFCSQAFRKMVEEEKLTGFGFERAVVVQPVSSDLQPVDSDTDSGEKHDAKPDDVDESFDEL